jgi:hypothetical protein
MAVAIRSRGSAGVVLVAVACVALAAAASVDPRQASEVCRPCHATRRGGVFDQWLASPYSDHEAGVGCRGCHADERLPAGCRMATTAAAPRPAAQRRRTADLLVAAVCRDGLVVAEVLVCNTGAGHALPSGETGSTLVLTVEALDAGGAPRACVAGPRLPPAAGAFAGAPGALYDADNALAPFATDVTDLEFAGPWSPSLTVRARLVRRRPAGQSSKDTGIEEIFAVASARVAPPRSQEGGSGR